MHSVWFCLSKVFPLPSLYLDACSAIAFGSWRLSLTATDQCATNLFASSRFTARRVRRIMGIACGGRKLEYRTPPFHPDGRAIDGSSHHLCISRILESLLVQVFQIVRTCVQFFLGGFSCGAALYELAIAELHKPPPWRKC